MPMNTNSKRFTDLHLSSWVNYFVATVITALLLILFFSKWFWILPFGLLLVFMISIAFSSYTIDLIAGPKSSSVAIKRNDETINLQSPIQARVWWNYTFKDKYIDTLDDGTPKIGPRSSDINVILEIKDKSGQKVTFVEKIVFGTRFPNEANYALDIPDANHPILKNQRVDKLIEYLKHQLEE